MSMDPAVGDFAEADVLVEGTNEYKFAFEAAQRSSDEAGFSSECVDDAILRADDDATLGKGRGGRDP